MVNDLMETRVSYLEKGFHELDKNNALLSGEVKNLSQTIGRLAVTMDKVSNELAVILPKIHISQQWETLFRNGIFFFVGLLVAGIVGVMFNLFMK